MYIRCSNYFNRNVPISAFKDTDSDNNSYN